MANPAATAGPDQTQFLAILVRPQGSGLERLFGLLRRRAATLLTYQVSYHRDDDYATMLLTIRGGRIVADQLAEHLRKQIDVHRVTVIDHHVAGAEPSTAP